MKNKILFICLILIMIPLTVSALVNKSTSEYVTDEADLLKDESEEYIIKYSSFLYKAKKIDFYVVTVETLEGMNIEEYTDAVYESFKIDDKGIIILASKYDRRLRIQVGDGLIDIIDGPKIDEFIEKYCMPYLDQNEWNDGIINGYTAIYKYICEEYDIDASSMEVVSEFDFLYRYKTPILLGIIFAISFFTKAYSKFYKKYLLKRENKNDVILLLIMIIINIFLVSLSYVLEPIYLLVSLVLEAIFFYMNFCNIKEKPIKQKRIRKRRLKKRIKKH